MMRSHQNSAQLLLLLCLLCCSIDRLDAFTVSEFKATKRSSNARSTAATATTTTRLEASLMPSTPTIEITRDSTEIGWGAPLLHMAGCFVAAIGLCMYEDFDRSTMKPNGYLQPHAVRGLGEGYKERLQDWRGGNILVNPKEDISVITIPSYNEINDVHRFQRLPNWKNSKVDEPAVRSAVHNLFAALTAVDQLKVAAADYSWEDMRTIIRQPALTTQLEQACSLLRRATFALSDEARSEIGFDWGSCAWRHCGAEADAQESLAELYNLVGVLEPFECQFVLDIVERSIRDVLAVVPVKYYDQALVKYDPYHIRDAKESETKLDEEFLNTINDFRNPQWDDE